MWLRKRRPARLPRVHSRRDEQRLFTRMDLAIRAISAIGILLLGVAGWLFQVRTEQTRRERDERDRTSRRYLPLLRSLTELELTAYTGAEAFADAGRVTPQTRAATARQLDASAQAIVLGGDDPIAPIELPDVRQGSTLSRRYKFRVRATAVMVADLLKALDGARQFYREEDRSSSDTIQLWFDHGEPRVQVHAAALRGNTPIGFLAHRESVEIWRAWVGDEPLPISHFEAFVGLVLRALHQQSRTAIDQLLAEHPELGEAYVTIRRNAVIDYRKP